MGRALLCAVLMLSAPAVDPLEPLPPAQRDTDRARAAFDAGAEAYGEGKYADAIPLFLEAFRHSGRSGPIFSLAQAHRKRFEADGDPRQRQLALLRYEQYLEFDPDGTRRVEAERYIDELLEASELEGPGTPPAPVTRLSLAAAAPGATASIDGGPSIALPAAPEVEPGRHRVEFSAPGHHSKSRSVEAPEGATVTVDVTLSQLEAELTIEGPEGAEVWVDGQRLARTPQKAPVRVEPGARRVAVARRGRALFVRDVDLAAGERRTLEVDLERTGQRKVAFATIAVGSASAAASLVLTGLALSEQAKMQRFWDDRDAGPLPESRIGPYEEAEARRSAYRNWAIGAGVFGALAIGTGIVLIFTDKRPVPSRLNAAPAVGRSGGGAVLRGRF